MSSGIYTPLRVSARAFPARQRPLLALIDTGAAGTLISWAACEDTGLLHPQNGMPFLHVFTSASNHSIHALGFSALIRVPIGTDVSKDTSHDDLSMSSSVPGPVFAPCTVDQHDDDETPQSLTEDRRPLGDFDVLLGLDVISQFRMTVDGPHVRFDPST